MFNHAEERRVAVFIPADFTKAVFRKKAAFRAGFDLSPCLFDGIGKVLGCPGGGGE
jgi:hypothetical protein